MIATVVASAHGLPETQNVWGTGGWLPPAQREALDWLTMLKLLGWQPVIARESPDQPANLEAGVQLIIFALDPADISSATATRLEELIAGTDLLIISRAAPPGSACARLSGVARAPGGITGNALRWSGPGSGRTWQCRAALAAAALTIQPDVAVWTTLNGMPFITARRVARGTIATIAEHPSAARDADGAATALLRHLLVWGAERSAAWPDFDGAVVLRMDDPGGAQNVYSRTWHHQKLNHAAWTALGADLRARQARLSIAYVAAWVDDGDAHRGDLSVAGVSVERRAGAVHPTPAVRYVDRTGHAPGTVHDYTAEYEGIEALRAAGLADVELHGHTHMHPDAQAWSAAADRYENVSWYRELGADAASAIARRSPAEHPLTLACNALQQYFHTWPTTLISPGDQWTDDVLQHALLLGIELVDSYYLALRHDDRYCWAQHICAPYIDQPAASWFDAGVPFVGYFHDRDIAIHGQAWLSNQLDNWQEAGARRWLDFRELAAALAVRCSVDESGARPRLVVTTHSRHPPIRDIPMCIRFCAGSVPETMDVLVDGVMTACDVIAARTGVGRVRIPVR